MILHQIRPELLPQYCRRVVNQKIKWVGLGLAVFAGLFFLFTYKYRVHHIVFPPLAILLALIFLIIWGVLPIQTRQLASHTAFLINEEGVSTFLQREGLNLANQIGVARNEGRYGARFDDSIAFKQLESTRITEHELVFRSINENPLNGNGKIAIPKEVEGFETLVAQVKADPRRYKLKS